MINGKDNPFSSPGSWQIPSQLLAFNKSRHEAFADFIHGCSPDPATRIVATTALVLSFWQLKGHSLTPGAPSPSMILVNAGESASDPIDSFIRGLVYEEESTKPKVQREGAFMGIPVEQAPKVMKNAFLARKSLGRDIPVDGSDKYYEAKNAELKFQTAKATTYGRSNCRRYTKAWHPEYGLLTCDNNELILSLNDKSDRSAFCKDLGDDPDRLAFPQGIGQDLYMVPKRVSISGSVTPGVWKRRTVGSAINLGCPLFALPHCAAAPLEPGHEEVFKSFATIWNSAPIHPVSASLRLPGSEWVAAYQTGLRRRLKMLPGNYEFAILQAVRQLDGICDRITNFAGASEAELEKRVALCRDLYQHSLRGMVLGVVGLSWYGPGLYLRPEGEPLRKEAFNLLKFLRNQGATSKSKILQRCHLKKHQRDILLKVLAAEDLLRVDGATVSATTYSEFVSALYKREEFPPVTNHWAEVQEG